MNLYSNVALQVKVWLQMKAENTKRKHIFHTVDTYSITIYVTLVNSQLIIKDLTYLIAAVGYIGETFLHIYELLTSFVVILVQRYAVFHIIF